MENQQEKVKHLLELIQENPNLEIMPIVDNEVVCGDDFRYWAGSWDEASVDEYWVDNERIYFKSHDEDELIDNVAYNIDESEDDIEAMKKAEKIVKGYDWIKVIVVYITTPQWL